MEGAKGILALDLGTKTGYAYWDGEKIHYGEWDLSGSRFEGGGMRFLRFKRHLAEFLPNLRYIVYEEVRDHSSFIPNKGPGPKMRKVYFTDQAHSYGGFWSHLATFGDEEHVPYEGIPVGSIKKHATGKGNAKKPDMIAAARGRLQATLTDKQDNAADARWMLDMALIRDGVLEPSTLGRFALPGQPPPVRCGPDGKFSGEIEPPKTGKRGRKKKNAEPPVEGSLAHFLAEEKK